MNRIAAAGAALALLTLAGCGGSAGRVGIPSPVERPSESAMPSLAVVDVPIPSACVRPDHQPVPAYDAPVPPVPPEPITKVPPAYPDAARARNIQGLVRLRVLVCEHGRVIEAKAVESLPGLDQAAAEALAQWTFKPAERDGQPVAAWVEEPIRFSLH